MMSPFTIIFYNKKEQSACFSTLKLLFKFKI